MNFGDYLFDDEISELSLTDKLLLMDRALMELHSNGMYIASNILDIVIENDKIVPSSIIIEQFDSEKNNNSYEQDIMELGAIGLCAYNRFGEYEGFPKYFTSPEFIYSLKDNIELYLNKEDIPEVVKDYYRTIFTLFEIKYMNNYLEEMKKDGRENSKQRVLVYTTPAGKIFSEEHNNQSAFASIIAIPAVLAIVYLISMFVIIVIKSL